MVTMEKKIQLQTFQIKLQDNMDLRIVNTCDSDCMYCLEQSLRKKQKFISRKEVFLLLQQYRNQTPDDTILAFYWWNPLMHPDLMALISDATKLWFKSISLLTNTQWITQNYLASLISHWLTWISFYFHSLESEIHDMIVQDGISLEDLYKNISLIQKSGLSSTCIIHVHQQNIQKLYKIVAELYVKYSVRNFEFIRVRLHSRAINKFREQLEIITTNEEKDLENLQKILHKLPLHYTFTHFENI